MKTIDSSYKKRNRKGNLSIHYVPLLKNQKIRTTVGYITLLLSFLMAKIFILKGIQFDISSVKLIIVISLAWVISLLFTQKYSHKYSQRYTSYLVASHLKFVAFMVLFCILLLLPLNKIQISGQVLWSTICIFTFIDAIFSLLRRRQGQTPNTYKALSSLDVNRAESLLEDLSGDVKVSLATPVDIVALFQNKNYQFNDSLLNFFSKNMNCPNKSSGNGVILDETKPIDKHQLLNPVSLLANLVRLNDIRRLNKFLLYSHKNILSGGWFLCRYTSLEIIKKKLHKRYRGLWFYLISSFHFIFHRIFPKIPRVNMLYFMITRGRNRVLSKAEVWGRLYFCGFEVLDEMSKEDDIFVIAKKVRTPSCAKKPTYYPIVSLERVGLNGTIIKSYKIRTMFPFSEFLQKRIFDDKDLSSIGKIKNDFRITEYGRILRKYWLDEIPQILNWIRGDIKLVGIRAMSQHYFSLYPKDYQRLYLSVKPGLIPPIFDESTESFDKIIEIEQNYLEQYTIHPIKTDIHFFWKTFKNIMFKGVRSR